MKGIGQLCSDKSVVIPTIPPLPLRLGRGTDGGFVVHLRAAKYKQSAGPSQEREAVQYRDTPNYAFRAGLPVIIRSPSALLSSSVLTNLSTFAWVREDLRYEWKQSWTNSSDRRNDVVVMGQEVYWGVQRSGVVLRQVVLPIRPDIKIRSTGSRASRLLPAYRGLWRNSDTVNGGCGKVRRGNPQ